MAEDMSYTSLGLGLTGGDFSNNRRPNKSSIDLYMLFPPWVKKEEQGKKNNNEEEKGARKKLKLTKDQSVILEESFTDHNTLNQNQKQQLAERLSLRPRQVEVWFQNRRARTKSKQLEANYEFLKKCCEGLSDENKRLKKELHELRSTLRMCTSCESITILDDGQSSAELFQE